MSNKLPINRRHDFESQLSLYATEAPGQTIHSSYERTTYPWPRAQDMWCTSTTHLPEACDSREYHVVFFNILFIPRHFFLYNQYGDHQGHFPLQYIEKLRGEFIRLVFRRKAPLFVIRGSFFSLKSRSHSSFAFGSVARSFSSRSFESTTIERNL